MRVNEPNILRMKELIDILKEADVAYYRDDSPTMTDMEYDRLTDELAFDPDAFGRHTVQQGEVKYLLQSPGCGDESETHTVREWLGDFDIALKDKAFIRWNQALSEISLKMQELEKTHDSVTMMEIWFVTRVILYECYEPDKEFLPQYSPSSSS